MPDSMLAFSLEKSNEKLTARGMIALLDEYIEALGLPDRVDWFFPAPGSNRGIAPADYVRTLMYHYFPSPAPQQRGDVCRKVRLSLQTIFKAA